MKGIRRGWRLARRTIGVLRADASLALFPLLGTVSALLAFALLIAPGAVAALAIDAWWPLVPFALAAAYAATYSTVYFNVALAGAAAESLQGRDTGLADGLSVARRRRGVIARWAMLQATVGLALHGLHAVAQGNPAARVVAALVGGLGGVAWGIATFFAIPVLALEGVGPKEALARSASLVRARWGEGLGGTAAIAAAVILAGLVPATVLVAVAFGIGGTALTVALTAIAGLVVLAAVVVGTALNAIFRVVLYRYARTGRAAPGFMVSELEGALI